MELSTIQVPGQGARLPARSGGRWSTVPRWAVLALVVLGQAAISLAMWSAPILGLLHAGAVLAVGLYALARRDASLVMCTCAYLAGSEVLWRQVEAPVFYLAAPYLLILLTAGGLVLLIGRLGRDARVAMIYVALLLPSVIATVGAAGAESRQLLAFSLSGPVALATSVAFMSQLRATQESYRRVLWSAAVSAIGPLTIAVASTRAELASQGEIEFSTQSNWVTSGGFGPVQVSAVLGLGVLATVVLTVVERDRVVRVLAALLAAAFTVQSLLTFSRGGMFSTAIALSALAIFNARNRRIRNRILVVVAVALTLGYFVVLPWLADFTDGAFQARFTNTSSGRTELAGNDFTIFEENPAFGVGPGMTKFQRLSYDACQLRTDRCDEEASSHTEFTRLLGEHGVPGILATVALAVLAVRALRRARVAQPFAVGFLAWAVAQMFYANLRVVAVPFAFGLAFLTVAAPRAPISDPQETASP